MQVQMTPLPKGIKRPVIFHDASGKHLVAEQAGEVRHWLLVNDIWEPIRALEPIEAQIFYERNKGLMICGEPSR